MSSEPVIPHSGRCVNIPCSPFMFVVLLQVFVVVVVVAQIVADARSCLYSVSSEAVILFLLSVLFLCIKVQVRGFG